MECVLLGRNFDFVGGYFVVTAHYIMVTIGYCSLPGGYCSLPVGFFFFSIRVFFTNTDDSQDSKRRKGTIFYSTLPLPLRQLFATLYVR